MAKITDQAFRQWKDGETITSSEYVKEREILRVATNDNDTRLLQAEADIDALDVKATGIDNRLKTVETVSDSVLRTDLDTHTGDTTIHLGSTDRENLAKIPELDTKRMAHHANGAVKTLQPNTWSRMGFNITYFNLNGLTKSADNIFTIPKAGYYRFQFQTTMETDTTGSFNCQIWQINTNNKHELITALGNSGGNDYVTGERIIWFNEGDLVEFVVRTTCTTAKNMYTTYAIIEKI